MEFRDIKIQNNKKYKKYLLFRYSNFLFNKAIARKNREEMLKTKSDKKGPVISNKGNKVIGNLEIKTFSI